MSLLDRFKKETKSGTKTAGGAKSEVLPPYLLRAGKKLDKGMYLDLLRIMKSHNLKAAIGVFANTTDNFRKDTALVINKGVVSKKIVGYLHEMRINHIERALDHVKMVEPDSEGFYTIDDKLADRLNLPTDIVVLPVFSGSKTDMGVILVAHKTMGNLSQFATKVKKLIK